MDTDSTKINFSFPIIPDENIYLGVNLRIAGFRPSPDSKGVRVHLFSDLKRYDMGSDLAESGTHYLADKFITARLWGVADTAPYLHDGRAMTLTKAITLHGGDAQVESDNFQNLLDDQKEDLLNFLRSLRTPGSGDIGNVNPNPIIPDE